MLTALGFLLLSPILGSVQQESRSYREAFLNCSAKLTAVVTTLRERRFAGESIDAASRACDTLGVRGKFVADPVPLEEVRGALEAAKSAFRVSGPVNREYLVTLMETLRLFFAEISFFPVGGLETGGIPADVDKFLAVAAPRPVASLGQNLVEAANELGNQTMPMWLITLCMVTTAVFVRLLQ
jgi:hypothetical protein